MFIKFNSKLNQNRGMKNRDPIVNYTFADVVEDETNEWITGVVPVEIVEVVPEPEAVQVVASTSSKRKRVSRPRKKRRFLPVYRDDVLQPASSSEGSSSEDDDVQSPSHDADSE